MRWLFAPGVCGVGVGRRSRHIVAVGVRDVRDGGFGVLANGGGNLFPGTASIELDGSKNSFPEHELCFDGEGPIGNIRAGGGFK